MATDLCIIDYNLPPRFGLTKRGKFYNLEVNIVDDDNVHRYENPESMAQFVPQLISVAPQTTHTPSAPFRGVIRLVGMRHRIWYVVLLLFLVDVAIFG